MEEDPIGDLMDLLEKSNAKVSFDPERNFTRPCFLCGETSEPRNLITLVFGDLEFTRPFCKVCSSKASTVTERYCWERKVECLHGMLRRYLESR